MPRRTHCRNGHEYTEGNTTSQPSRPGTRTCLQCQKERLARWVSRNRDRVREMGRVNDKKRVHHPHRVYARRKRSLALIGWTPEQYDTVHKEQGGLCAICKQPESAKGKSLSADHDHNTGARRKLLCGACNIGLGKFKDDPVRLEVAAAYLRDYAS